MFDKMAVYTITAPSGVDGRGEVAVVNDLTSGNFVGTLHDLSRSVDVRLAEDALNQAHGVILGGQWYGHAAYTMQIMVARAATWAASFARRDKLLKATNAMASDLTVAFTESGGVARQFTARRSSYPSGPDDDSMMSVELIGADPRVYSVTAVTGASPLTNAGNADAPPTVTVTPTTNPVTIANTTTGKQLVLLVGTGYVTTGGGPVTVDFGAKTVVQGGVEVPQAIDYPSSEWWEMIPGSNAYSVTNGSSVTVSFHSAWL